MQRKQNEAIYRQTVHKGIKLDYNLCVFSINSDLFFFIHFSFSSFCSHSSSGCQRYLPQNLVLDQPMSCH